MLPEIARRAISFYSKPGEMVLDPMCGIATTLVEAIHQNRQAIGVELEPRWATLATKNIEHAREQGASGWSLVLQDDARRLGRGVLDEITGQVALILTSPPYANTTLGDPRGGDGIARARACEGRPVTAADRAHASRASRSCRYGSSPASVARLRYGTIEETVAPTPHAGQAGNGQSYLSSMAAIYAACALMLKPGGHLILVTRNMRANGALRNITGDTIRLCEHAGLVYQQHIVALLATIRDSQIVPRPSFWQLTHARRSLAKGEPIQLACHEDVLVFRKPESRLSSGNLKKPQKTTKER
jgi:DNA modification methylase